MDSKTQKLAIIAQLREKGSVSRNWALEGYISRLGAIICDLKNEGWEFTAGYVEKNGGKDYVYIVTKDPERKPEQTAMFTNVYKVNDPVWKL